MDLSQRLWQMSKSLISEDEIDYIQKLIDSGNLPILDNWITANAGNNIKYHIGLVAYHLIKGNINNCVEHYVVACGYHADAVICEGYSYHQIGKAMACARIVEIVWKI